ncbi:pilus assembly protein N-terminal domain-containing protein [Hyphomonas sp.]|uniref:pilus assembly protein N-terminal domain-containing protein n=1 Tax=Hyphomonas sp. TaxID=87 RepID=UPI00391AAA63
MIFLEIRAGALLIMTHIAKPVLSSFRACIRASALAASLALAMASTAAANQLSVETSKTVPVRLSGAASSIVVGNKNVADVAVHSENLIFVTGKSYGTTNLIVVDRGGREIYNAEVIVTANSSNLVVINRAGQHFSYDCTPVCRGAVNLGDDPEHFANLVQQQIQIQTLNEGN